MDKIKERLLSKLSVYNDDKYGLCIALTDYEHLDYIDGVLTEHFDILCDAQIVDDENQKYVFCFGEEVSFDELSLAIDEINSYHEKHRKLYETI